MDFEAYGILNTHKRSEPVYLKDGNFNVMQELKISRPTTFGTGTMRFTAIVSVYFKTIPARYTYLVRDNGDLWTMDGDGNPKSKSVFKIKNGE